MTEFQYPDFDRVADGWAKWDDWLEQSYRAFDHLLLQRAGIADAAEKYREGNEVRIPRTALLLSAKKPDV